MDLVALLAQLKAPADGQASDASHAPTSNDRQPYVSTSLGSPPVASPQPQSLNRAISVSGILSPVNAPVADRAASDRTVSLLNLLKFNQPTSGSNLGIEHAASPAARSVSLQVPASGGRGESLRPSTSGTPQDLLLKLLNPGQAASNASAKPIEVAGEHETAGNVSDNAAASVAPSVNKAPFSFVSPWEQLAASSPRNKSSKSPAPSATPTSRTQIEALLGIGNTKPTETTVSEALDKVGKEADLQAQEAIERADIGSHAAQAGLQDGTLGANDIEQTQNIKAESQGNIPDSVPKATEDTMQSTAQEAVADSWESADAEDFAAKDDSAGVRVLNFPMKPFVSIDLVNLPTARAIRDDIVMKIASMKKEFDQVDRTLASATSDFIVYALARGGGLRIIRQDDGQNKQVFRKAGNEMYNVNISAPASGPSAQPNQTVLATGINGSVFWTSINVNSEERFEDADLDKLSLIFPPVPTAEDNNPSGGQLKTRAKPSSRHPDFFALSRGKSIHIIWPQLASNKSYVDEKSRVVDTEKYLAERCLKIATGKSGKDFAFSEDDTVIVSLDKAGRLKFWDIREHINASEILSSAYRTVETKTPLMIMPTTSGAEKSWATSVQFVDKERPMTKGVGLRYLLVGSKQNHTLQLWDLGLKKAVQEVNFPHGNENDAICTVCYHAKSGIIAVGHPTRNSVFFIYLSAPRYNLGGISQAEYISRLAANDKTLPTPESTAIMTGIRELTLGSYGHLRSIQLSESAPPNVKPDNGDETMFEVYVAHSRGIASLDIKRQDLGWDKNSKAVDPVNAAAEKIIEVRELGVPQPEAEPSEPVESKAEPVEHEAAPTDASKDIALEKVTGNQVETLSFAPSGTTTAGRTPVTTSASASTEAPAQAPSEPNDVSQAIAHSIADIQTGAKAVTSASATNGTSMPAAKVSGEDVSAGAMNIDAAQLGETISKALGNTLSVIFGSVLGEQLETLYKRFDDDKRVSEAAGAAKQDAILRLISSTLTDNVEKSLTRIVSSNIEKSIIPAVTSVTSEAIKQQLAAIVPNELKASLQGPIAKAMQEPTVLKSITDNVSGKVAAHVESVFSTTLDKTIAPAFQKLAVDTARKATSDVEQRVNEQIQKINVQSKSDSAKIDRLVLQHQTDSGKFDQLTTLTMQMLEGVRGLTDQLAAAQVQILSLKSQLAEQKAQPAPVTAAAPEDPELAQLTELMASGKLTEGTIKWLQSERRVELFNHLFSRYDPAYLRDVDQLITLSVCAAISDSFEGDITPRLHWLEVAMSCIDPQDPVVAEHATRVMDALVQRLSETYMARAESEPNNTALDKIVPLVSMAKKIKQNIKRAAIGQ